MQDSFLKTSFRDELTRLFNRKVLDIIMKYAEKMFKSSHTDYTIVMFDVDKFKQMNDEHGHVFGDIILRNVAKCIEDRARSSDFVVRYGGDEFLVVQTKDSKN
jgi:diguanylate cyclase (GGDEF)-like protein